MTKRSYGSITNVALILGLLSAFMYDSGRVPHVLAIGLAIVAGLMSLGAYLYNAFVSSKAEKVDHTKCEPNRASPDFVMVDNASGGVIVAKGKSTTLPHSKDFSIPEMGSMDESALEHAKAADFSLLSAYFEQMLGRDTKRKNSFMHQYLLQNNAGRRLRYQFPSDNRLITPEVELSTKETASCAADIIRELTTDNKEWDFVFDSKGLRVSQKRVSANPYDDLIEFDDEDAEATYYSGIAYFEQDELGHRQEDDEFSLPS